MARRLVVVAEGIDGAKEPSAVSGTVHVAPADNWHETLCGKDVPYEFGPFDRDSFIDLLQRGTNAYPCGPCGDALRSMGI